MHYINYLFHTYSSHTTSCALPHKRVKCIIEEVIKTHILGIIAEYNPFHYGHKYHLSEARRASKADYVIAVMDGHFTQRGDPAALSKWTRTRMALTAGIDAVFELPALFAVRPAEIFAFGGVWILDRLGADSISFGSEISDPSLLQKIADMRAEEPRELSELMRSFLNQGMSHARAMGMATAKLLGLSPQDLDQPNTALAIEYLKAIRKINSKLVPYVIPRLGDYRSVASSNAGFPSATCIRKAFRSGSGSGLLPDELKFAAPEIERSHGIDDIVMWAVRQMPVEKLSQIIDVSEGLENRIKRMAANSASLEDLLDKLKCRRYTRARLNRILTLALLGADKALTARYSSPVYARLLGLRKEASPLMAELKKRANIDIISDPLRFSDNPMFDLEVRATDAWALSRNAPEERRQGLEFINKFVLV